MSGIAPHPPKPPPDRGGPRRDSRGDPAARLLYLVAALLGGACLALALWGWGMGRRFESQLAGSAEVQAELLAREFSEDVRFSANAANAAVYPSLLLLPGWWEEDVLDLLRANVDSAIACRCVRLPPATGGYFVWNSREPERLVHDGLDSAVIEPLRRRLVQLAGTLRLVEVRQVVLKVDADNNPITAPVVMQSFEGTRRIAGYLSSAKALADAQFLPAATQAERARFGDAGSAFVSWVFVGPAGDTVLRRGAPQPGVPSVSVAFLRSRFQTDSGVPEPGATADPQTWPYWVTIGVSPEGLGRHLYGGMPASPVPIWLLVGGALALGIAAVALARRFVAQVREREAFASAVAHDLRTPLTQILLYGESLQLDRPAAQARHDAARIIVRETRRLIHLVEGALQFTGRGGARPTLQLAPMPLDRAVGEVVAGFLPVFQRAGMTLVAERLEPATVVADRDAVVQVLTNLLENAERFGPAGQRVQLELRIEGSGAVLTVDDEGAGIPAAERERVFEPFVHDPASPGAGVGLAVSRQLVDLMDGSLTCTAAPVGGARFVLRLPLAGRGADVSATH